MVETNNKPNTVDLSNPKWFEAAGIFDPMAKPRPVRNILADNVKRLIGYTKGARSKIPQSFLVKKGVSQASIGRILRADTGAGIETVEIIAEHFGMAPWQLLVEDLDPDRRPVLRLPDGKEAEFYRRIREIAEEMEIEGRSENLTELARDLLDCDDSREERLRHENEQERARSLKRYGPSEVARTERNYGGTNEQQDRGKKLDKKARDSKAEGT